jgi:hypothetical protein
MGADQIDNQTYQERRPNHGRSLSGLAQSLASLFHPGLFFLQRPGFILVCLRKGLFGERKGDGLEVRATSATEFVAINQLGCALWTVHGRYLLIISPLRD